MSALGHVSVFQRMSALPLRADMLSASIDVRFVPESDKDKIRG
jgi:hypothetical protein